MGGACICVRFRGGEGLFFIGGRGGAVSRVMLFLDGWNGRRGFADRCMYSGIGENCGMHAG